MLSLAVGSAVAFSPATSVVSQSRVAARANAVTMDSVVVGIAADSGCGKSTFMRRLTSIFGGESKLLDIGRETNTLVSDMTTVICLDDYHKWDRTGRKSNPEWPDGITALHEACQDWDKMAADVTDLKAGKTVSKPIYNHITGELDPYEEVPATPIVIFEGLHPMHDDRVNEALDLTVYLDITDEVKFAWKAQRDIAERGATMEDVQAAIDARKPDFAAYVEPQKAKADIIVQVCAARVTAGSAVLSRYPFLSRAGAMLCKPSDLSAASPTDASVCGPPRAMHLLSCPRWRSAQVLFSDLIDDPTGKFLKVKLIQKNSIKAITPPYLMDEGAEVTWTPNKDKLSTSEPGVLFKSYQDDWFGQPVSVLEMDGKVDSLDELIYVESQLCNTGTKYYGELTEQMVANKDAPGSENGSGLWQTICAFKIREAFEAIKA